MNGDKKETVYHDGLTAEDVQCTCGAAEDTQMQCTCGILHIEVSPEGVTHIWPYRSDMRNKYYHPEWYQ